MAKTKKICTKCGKDVPFVTYDTGRCDTCVMQDIINYKVEKPVWHRILPCPQIDRP